jgi:thiol-disulfide isomerase/thioredoxin
MQFSRRVLLLSSSSALAFPGSGGEAPRFKAKSITGETFDNASVKGKVVLVQQWTTWCQFCRRDQASVDDVIETFGKDGLIVLAVNMGEPKKKVQTYLEQNPRKGHIVLLADTNLGAAFSGRGYPHYAVISRDGKLLGQQSGAGGPEALYHLLKPAGLEV